MDCKEKITILESLLEVFKIIDQEEAKLSDNGVHIDGLGYVGVSVWDTIKSLLDMPEEEKEGVFLSDYWIDIVDEFTKGIRTKEFVVSELIHWKEYLND